jgi:hypothetical protein
MKHLLNLRGEDRVEKIENAFATVFGIVFVSGLIFIYMSIS